MLKKDLIVNEVAKLTGVTVRTLHYYDKIGLLSPSKMTPAGYRLYDEDALARLQSILLFRELQFPLKEIKEILDSPSFDRNKALEQQITLLELKKEHLQNLIDLARGMKAMGWKTLDFSAFDTRKIDEYAAQTKAAWGQTEEWKEFEEKSKDWKQSDYVTINAELMGIFVRFGEMRTLSPQEACVQALVKELKDYITEHFYECTEEILSCLGKMYAGGGSFTENINRAGGEGTAEFAGKAIEIYCSN